MNERKNLGAGDENFLIKVHLTLLSDFVTYLTFPIDVKFPSFKVVFSIEIVDLRLAGRHRV